MKLTDTFNRIPGIYIIQNNINHKYYIGESVDIKERLFTHRNAIGNQVIHSAIKKYGIDNFSVYVEYFSYFKKCDLLDLEEQLIIKFNSLVPFGYNISKRGNDSTGYKHTPEAIFKIKQSWIDNPKRIFSDETKKKMSDRKKGKLKGPLSIETREQMSRSQVGRTHPPRSSQWRLKQSLSHRGKISPLKGRKQSPEHKEKIRIDQKRKKLSQLLQQLNELMN